jgi:putative transposase
MVYCDHTIEQDDRGINGRYHPMRGFGSFISAARFCSTYDELRDYFRHRTKMGEVEPLGVQQEQYCTRVVELRTMLKAA